MHAIIAAFLIAAAPAQAATPAQQDTPVFTEKDRAEVREALKSIVSRLDSEEAPKAADGKTEQKPQGKTMADVADKALDMSAKFVAQVAGLMEKVAPKVWRVMVVQQYAKAVGNIISPIIWIFIAFAWSIITRHFWKPDRNEKGVLDCSADEKIFYTVITLIAPLFAGVIATGVLASDLSKSAMYLINPEYYAVKDLFSILFGRGSM